MEEIWQPRYLYQENLHVHASRSHTNLGSRFFAGAVEPKPFVIHIYIYIYPGLISWFPYAFPLSV